MPHIHEKIDFVANVFVVNGDAVLLRKHDKHKIWLPPGGHIELDEDPAEAAVREIREEVGLDVQLISANNFPDGGNAYMGSERDGKDLPVPLFLNRHRINEIHEHISFEYVGVSETLEVRQGEQEVSDEVKWFTEEELGDTQYDVPARIQAYARKALTVAADKHK